MNITAILAADTKPSPDDLAEAFANDMARVFAEVAAKFGKESPAGFVPNADLAARLSRLVAIKLHRHEAEAEGVLTALHDVIEAENKAAYGLSADTFERAAEDFAFVAERAADAMLARAPSYASVA